jgi:hypothetical protein
VNFTLEDGEGLGLFTAAGVALDTRLMDSGSPSESRGLLPDASSAVMSLMPTPGAPNQLPNAVDTDADGIPDAGKRQTDLIPMIRPMRPLTSMEMARTTAPSISREQIHMRQ